MEIERKFLLCKMPEELERYPHSELEQGYLCGGETTVRIRKADDRYYLTIKKKPSADADEKYGAIVRIEIEEEITETLYYSLFRAVEGNPVTKTRYRIPYLSYVVELDVFHGMLEGLVTAEIEFPTVEEAGLTELPDWFGKDVSADRRYRNSAMSKMTREEAEKLVAESR